MQWAVFCALTAIHLYANYRAVKCLELTSLNRTRLRIAFERFVIGGEGKGNGKEKGEGKREGEGGEWVRGGGGIVCVVPTPAEVARVEHALLPWGPFALPLPPVRMGEDPHPSSSEGEGGVRGEGGALEMQPRHRYSLGFDASESVRVFFEEGVAKEGILRAYVHALCLGHAARVSEGEGKGKGKEEGKGEGRIGSIHAEALHWMRRQYGGFRRGLDEAGWDCNALLLEHGEWVYRRKGKKE